MNKIFFFFILITFTYSCKSYNNTHTTVCYDENYDEDTLIVFTFPFRDTIIVDQLHIHFEEKSLCCWIPEDTIIINDTLRLQLCTKKKYHVR